MWYAAGVDWSTEQQQGFALAAAARGDRAARAALPGLSAAVAASATAMAVGLANDDPAARRAWVRRMLAAQNARPAHDGTCPPRARALLAAEVDKALGRAWLAAAPLPRPGYAADPRLVALLRKLMAATRGELP
jgi:hypothetical protein